MLSPPQNVKKWLVQNGAVNQGRNFLKGFTNWDNKRVFEIVHKAYIQQLIAHLDPYAKPGHPGYLPLWRKAVSAGLGKMSAEQMKHLEETRDEWNRTGPPKEVQDK